MKTIVMLWVIFLHPLFVYAADIPETEIVIVGGGMAGLTAAHELEKANIAAILFEGRDRLGGRTNTHYLDPEKKTFFEEGGTFIDADHWQVQNLCQELNVELLKVGFGSHDITVTYNGQLQNDTFILETLTQLEEKLRHLWQNISSNYDVLLTFNPNTRKSTENPLLPHLNNLNDAELKFLTTYYTAETGIPIEKAPLMALGWIPNGLEGYKRLLTNKANPNINKEDIDSVAYHYTVKGGISTLVNAIAEKLAPKIHFNLNHKLTHIHKGDDGYYLLTFQTPGGEAKIKAAAVVMTLPFSTLRHVTIDESVPITDNQRTAIQTLSYATHAKVGTPLGASDNLFDHLLFYLNLDDQTSSWPGENAFTMILGGEKGKNANIENVQHLLEQQKPFVSTKYPFIQQWGTLFVKNWDKDQFSLGSYSGFMTGDDNALGASQRGGPYHGMRLYALPATDNRFFFAGEHTRGDGTSGYIEGAVRSGLQAAKFIRKLQER